MERKYAMTKARYGWLLLSDDARHLFMLAKYDEDGSAYWVDADKREHPIFGTFWGVQVLTREGERQVVTRDDEGLIVGLDIVAANDTDNWDWDDMHFPTRRAAEEAALKWAANR